MIIKDLLFRISPKLLASLEFYHVFGRRLNWKNPSDLNEKINWLKFKSDTSLWTKLADKYAVREYIEEKGFSDNLVKLYGKWDRPEDVDWELLPKQFVMKMNNGSGDIFVCRDKNKVDKNEVLHHFALLMNTVFGGINGEAHYALMKPCIIAEEFLDAEKQPIKTDTLIDYKIWCFDGGPYYVWACYNRHKDTVEVATYDLNWERHDEKSIFTNHYIRAQRDLPKPESLDKMLEMASKLSEGIPQVRVDLYEVGGKPYFGEMTFTSAGGFNDFYTQEFLNELGGYVNLGIAPKK